MPNGKWQPCLRMTDDDSQLVMDAHGRPMMLRLPEQDNPCLAAHARDMALLLMKNRPHPEGLNYDLRMYKGWLQDNGYPVPEMKPLLGNIPSSMQKAEQMQLWKAVVATLSDGGWLCAPTLRRSKQGSRAPESGPQAGSTYDKSADAEAQGASGGKRDVAAAPEPGTDAAGTAGRRFKGVLLPRPGKCLLHGAQINVRHHDVGNAKSTWLGGFSTAEEAACAYDMAVLLCTGRSARTVLNYPVSTYSDWLTKNGYSVPDRSSIFSDGPPPVASSSSGAPGGRDSSETWRSVEEILEKCGALRTKDAQHGEATLDAEAQEGTDGLPGTPYQNQGGEQDDSGSGGNRDDAGTAGEPEDAAHNAPCKFRGVKFKSSNCYGVQISLPRLDAAGAVKPQSTWIKSFKTAEKAACAYDIAALLNSGPDERKMLNYPASTYSSWLKENGYPVPHIPSVLSDAPPPVASSSSGTWSDAAARESWRFIEEKLEELGALRTRDGRPGKPSSHAAVHRPVDGLPAGTESALLDRRTELGMSSGKEASPAPTANAASVKGYRVKIHQPSGKMYIHLGYFKTEKEAAHAFDMGMLLFSERPEKTKLKYPVSTYSPWLAQNGYSVPGIASVSETRTPAALGSSSLLSDSDAAGMWQRIEKKMKQHGVLRAKDGHRGPAQPPLPEAPDSQPCTDRPSQREEDGQESGSDSEDGGKEDKASAHKLPIGHLVPTKPNSDRSASKYRGVTFEGSKVTLSRQWRANVPLPDGRPRFLGYFHTDMEAARAYDAKKLELYGPAATLTNFHYTDYYPALQRVPCEKGAHQVSRPESLGHLGVHFGCDIPDVFDESVVGRRIKIYISIYDQKWWPAQVKQYNAKTGWYNLIFDRPEDSPDGHCDTEWLRLWNEQVEWLTPQGEEAVSWEKGWEVDQPGVPECGHVVQTRFDDEVFLGTVAARVLATIRIGAHAGNGIRNYRYMVRYHDDGEEELLSADEVAAISAIDLDGAQRKKRKRKRSHC